MKKLLFILAILAACRGRNAATIATQPQRATPTVVGARQDMHAAKIKEIVVPDRIGVVERSEVKTDPVALTMWLKECPEGLQTSAKWLDDDGDTIAMQRKSMSGQKVATFALRKHLKPGHYRVVGYWGGNVAAQHDFVVR